MKELFHLACVCVWRWRGGLEGEFLKPEPQWKKKQEKGKDEGGAEQGKEKRSGVQLGARGEVRKVWRNMVML